MKTTLLLLSFFAISSAAIGQDTVKTKQYHNEFGIDATGFVKQFIFISTNNFPEYYIPSYFLTYRRHLKCGNIRFAIGGSFSDHDIPTAFTGDSNNYHYTSRSFDSRIGWEFSNELSKRWQVFYGMDFRPSFSYTKDDAPYWNGGYANGSEEKSQNYAIAPVLGFRFRINQRLSLSTEASFSLNFQQSESKRYYLPVSSIYPPKNDVIVPKAKTVFTGFSQPLSLFLTFDI